jgi:hypothetical protein
MGDRTYRKGVTSNGPHRAQPSHGGSEVTSAPNQWLPGIPALSEMPTLEGSLGLFLPERLQPKRSGR